MRVGDREEEEESTNEILPPPPYGREKLARLIDILKRGNDTIFLFLFFSLMRLSLSCRWVFRRGPRRQLIAGV